MKEAILCYLVKPAGRSRFWKMRYRLPGETKETQQSLKVRDERTAQRLMSDFITQQEREACGIVPSRKLRDGANAKLETLLRSYLQDLGIQNCAPKYVFNTGLFIRKIARETGWETVRDVCADGFTAWRATKKKSSPKTLNLYFGALRSFLNWLISNGTLPGNPLAGVKSVKDFTKVRERRSISDEEARSLLEAAPPERRIIYLMALHTGLRRKEMELLEWQDVFLDVESPFIKLRAITSKNRKGDTVVIHPELQAELEKRRDASASQCSRVVTMFPKLRAFMKDLAAAGIPFIDERGLRFDLHAMRMTFNTRMANGNIPTRAAMQAMRHSEERLTTKVYTDASRLHVAAHVASLPSLLGPVMVSARASGESESEGNKGPQTDTVALEWKPTGSPENQGFRYSLTHGATLCYNGPNGSGGWDRTNDLLDASPYGSRDRIKV